MLTHVVCFKMKPYANENSKEKNLCELKEKLESLPDKIAQIRSLQVGINERGGEYDAILVTLFSNREDLEVYDKSAPHIAVKEFIGKVCDKMSVIDYSF